MGRRHGEEGVTAMTEKLLKDLVCGMRMSPKEAAYASELRGMVYRFARRRARRSSTATPLALWAAHDAGRTSAGTWSSGAGPCSTR